MADKSLEIEFSADIQKARQGLEQLRAEAAKGVDVPVRARPAGSAGTPAAGPASLPAGAQIPTFGPVPTVTNLQGPPAPQFGPQALPAIVRQLTGPAYPNTAGGPVAAPGVVPVHAVRARVQELYGPQAAASPAFDEGMLDLWRRRMADLRPLDDMRDMTASQRAGGIQDADNPGNALQFVQLNPRGMAAGLRHTPDRLAMAASVRHERAVNRQVAAMPGPSIAPPPAVTVAGGADTFRAGVESFLSGPLRRGDPAAALLSRQPPESFAALAGAPAGSNVAVKSHRGGVEITAADPSTGYESKSILETSVTPGGGFRLRVDDVNLPAGAQSRGVGTAAFARQVEAARRLGVGRVVLHASRETTGGGENAGYYAWPRMGFEGEVPGFVRDRLAASADPAERAMAGAGRVSEFMATPAGRAAWRRHGGIFFGEFEVTPGGDSPHERALAAYAADKGGAGGPGAPWEAMPYSPAAHGMVPYRRRREFRGRRGPGGPAGPFRMGGPVATPMSDAFEAQAAEVRAMRGEARGPLEHYLAQYGPRDAPGIRSFMDRRVRGAAATGSLELNKFDPADPLTRGEYDAYRELAGLHGLGLGAPQLDPKTGRHASAVGPGEQIVRVKVLADTSSFEQSVNDAKRRAASPVTAGVGGGGGGAGQLPPGAAAGGMPFGEGPRQPRRLPDFVEPAGVSAGWAGPGGGPNWRGPADSASGGGAGSFQGGDLGSFAEWQSTPSRHALMRREGMSPQRVNVPNKAKGQDKGSIWTRNLIGNNLQMGLMFGGFEIAQAYTAQRNAETEARYAETPVERIRALQQGIEGQASGVFGATVGLALDTIAPPFGPSELRDQIRREESRVVDYTAGRTLMAATAAGRAGRAGFARGGRSEAERARAAATRQGEMDRLKLEAADLRDASQPIISPSLLPDWAHVLPGGHNVLGLSSEWEKTFSPEAARRRADLSTATAERKYHINEVEAARREVGEQGAFEDRETRRRRRMAIAALDAERAGAMDVTRGVGRFARESNALDRSQSLELATVRAEDRGLEQATKQRQRADYLRLGFEQTRERDVLEIGTRGVERVSRLRAFGEDRAAALSEFATERATIQRGADPDDRDRLLRELAARESLFRAASARQVETQRIGVQGQAAGLAASESVIKALMDRDAPGARAAQYQARLGDIDLREKLSLRQIPLSERGLRDDARAAFGAERGLAEREAEFGEQRAADSQNLLRGSLAARERQSRILATGRRGSRGSLASIEGIASGAELEAAALQQAGQGDEARAALRIGALGLQGFRQDFRERLKPFEISSPNRIDFSAPGGDVKEIMASLDKKIAELIALEKRLPNDIAAALAEHMGRVGP